MRIYILLTYGYHVDYFGWTTSWRKAKKWLAEEREGNVVRLTFRPGIIVEHHCWVWGEWKEERE